MSGPLPEPAANKWVRSHIDSTGKNYSTIAKEMGISKSSFGSYIHDECSTSKRMHQLFAEYFGLTYRDWSLGYHSGISTTYSAVSVLDELNQLAP